MSDNFRTAGKKKDGKLVKGILNEASLPNQNTSIPVSNQNTIYKNYSLKAFQSSSLRFPDVKQIQVPGPGSYSSTINNDSTLPLSNKSELCVSQKGFGNGFASKNVRDVFNRRYINSGPGPGQYQFKISKDQKFGFFNGSDKNSFKELSNNQQPGPGQYNLQLLRSQNKNTYQSCFNSKSIRNQKIVNQIDPAPGSYEIQQDLLKKYEIFELSEFQKQQNLRLKEKQQYTELQNLLLSSNQNTQENEEIPSQFQKDYRNMDYYFMQGVKNRFGDLLDNKLIERQINIPGPGQYDLIQKDIPIQQAQNSVFLSITKRDPYKDYANKLGPIEEKIVKPKKKKNFHLNLNKVWVQQLINEFTSF